MKLKLTLIESNRRIARSLEREGINLGDDPYFVWHGEELEITVHSPDEQLHTKKASS